MPSQVFVMAPPSAPTPNIPLSTAVGQSRWPQMRPAAGSAAGWQRRAAVRLREGAVVVAEQLTHRLEDGAQAGRAAGGVHVTGDAENVPPLVVQPVRRSGLTSKPLPFGSTAQYTDTGPCG